MASFCRCGAVVGADGCSRCSKPRPSVHHKTTKQRGYGSDWKELSERYRRHYPLCEDCLKNGKITPSTQVHHIVPINEDVNLRLTWQNLAALCVTCHNARHVSK